MSEFEDQQSSQMLGDPGEEREGEGEGEGERWKEGEGRERERGGQKVF